MNEEWGPWVEHDGKGCLVPGKFVEVEGRHIDTGEMRRVAGVAEPDGLYWDWGNLGRVVKAKGRVSRQTGRVVWRLERYRVRKPRGMAILEGILARVETKHRKRERA